MHGERKRAWFGAGPYPFTRGGPPGRTPGRKLHAATAAAAASPPDPPRIVSGKALDDAPLVGHHRGEGVNGYAGPLWLALAVAAAGCNFLYSWDPIDVGSEASEEDAGDTVDGPDDADPDLDVGPDEIEGGSDGDGDVPPEDGEEGDAEADADADEADGADDGPADDARAVCGNGVIEPPDEECEGTTTQACVTSCGSSGVETCSSCQWGVCETPDEVCNGIDDDCNGLTDEVGGGFACPDGCCNGTENACSCAADCGATVEPTIPVLRAPPNGARTGSVRAPVARNTLRPLFRWEASSGGCGAITYDVQVDGSCPAPTWRTCVFPSPEAWVTDVAATQHRPTADLAVSTAPPVGRRYYWRVRACSGAACSPWSAVRYLDVGRVPGDFNGDGYSDAAAGAIAHSAGATLEGGAFVYGGAAGGPPATPDWRLDCPGNQAEAYFGVSMASAGDVDADGYDDLVVGAYAYDAGSVDEGGAFLYLGSAAGPAALPDVTWDNPSGMANSAFGLAVGSAGDVDGDGYADVVVAAPLFDGAGADEGRAYVYRGSATGPGTMPDHVLGAAASIAQANAQFGLAVGSAGDMNGDGYADLAVGAPLRDVPPVDGGAVYLFLGSSTGLDPTAPIQLDDPVAQANAFFGQSVAAAGDLDGDGFGELLVGAPGQSATMAGEGNAFVLAGSATDPGGTSMARLLDPPGELSAEFGTSVAGAGDIDGDGVPDLIVGARYQDAPATDSGQAFVYYGPVSGSTASADVELSPPTPLGSARFGASVGAAGDVDGDGFADVIIGEPLRTDVTTFEGGAYVYAGSAAGVGSTPLRSWRDPDHMASAYFGYAVCRSGW